VDDELVEGVEPKVNSEGLLDIAAVAVNLMTEKAHLSCPSRLSDPRNGQRQDEVQGGREQENMDRDWQT
jgi:hypothetical protein